MGWVGTVISVAMMGAGLISSLFSKQTISQTDPVIGAIKITTSAFGMVRPVLYGINRTPANMIWYGDYQAIPHTTTTSAGGKGGGQTYSQTSWTYKASFALGLCEGQIAQVSKGWAGNQVLDLYPASTAEKIFVTAQTSIWTIKTGTDDQTPWAYLTSNHPTQDLRYLNLAYVAAVSYNLGSYPSLPNFSFIVEGQKNYYGEQDNIEETHEFDTSVTVIKSAVWLSTNTVKYGQATAELTEIPVYVDTDTFTVALKADNFFVAGRAITVRFDDDSTATTTIVSSSYGAGVTTVNLTDAVLTETPAIVSCFIGGGPFSLVEVITTPGAGEYRESSGVYAFSADEMGDVKIDYDYSITSGGNPAEILTDIITNGFYGLGLSSSVIDMATYDYEDFCLANEFFLSPLFASQSAAKDVVELLLKVTNTEVVWADGKIVFIPLGDESVSSDYASWTPNLTPACQLTYDDIDDEGEDSLVVSRSTARDAYNHVAIQHVNRENEFNAETTEYQDQGDIVTNGKRSLGTISANGIITKTLALKIGRMLCKRSMVARNQFTFSLPLSFIYLRCLDIVGLTSARHGLNQLPVRITNLKISQTSIKVEATDLGLGSGSAPTTAVSGAHGNYSPNMIADPGDANEPLIWLPPLDLANYEVWMATAGGAYWGGCHVWVSQDGTTYSRAGTMVGGCRYGELTDTLPDIATSPDETNTLAVDLSVSSGSLGSGTEDEADDGRTLCYVDGEYLAYATATLTGSYGYDLTYLVRGLYGSTIEEHLSGSHFVRLDDAIFSYPIGAADIGKTIYVKLQSFNIHGNAVQDLADLTAYEFVVPDPGDEIIELESPY